MSLRSLLGRPVLWFNVAVVVAAAVAFGPLLERFDEAPRCTEETTGTGPWEPDPDVSYRLRPNARYRVRRTCDGVLRYDARYGTGPHRARISRPAGRWTRAFSGSHGWASSAATTVSR